jgi:hypothetical protein
VRANRLSGYARGDRRGNSDSLEPGSGAIPVFSITVGSSGRLEQASNHPLQIGGGVAFQETSVRAGLGGLLGDLRRIVHREHDDFDRGRGSTDAASGFDSVHDGHADVEDHEIGLEFKNLFDRLLSIFGLAADVPVGRTVEQGSDATTHDLVVVGQKNFVRQFSPFQG